jgi:hypothetical protein
MKSNHRSRHNESSAASYRQPRCTYWSAKLSACMSSHWLPPGSSGGLVLNPGNLQQQGQHSSMSTASKHSSSQLDGCDPVCTG